MRKIILFTIALLLSATAARVESYAQSDEKKETEKPRMTTADAWRQSLPGAEQTSEAPPQIVAAESRDRVETRETPAQIERRILDLEQRLMSSLKARDAVSLNHLLADDFVLAGVSIAGAQPDKTRFIQWALKNLELKSYNLEKTTVRAYPSAAIVTYQYKRQATVAGAPSDGSFLVTDVWVKRASLWQAVSHHISELPKQ